jgi:hypothetical protein
MMQPDQPVTLHLVAADVQTILGVLGKAPYDVVAPIIAKIHRDVLGVDPDAFGPAPARSINGDASHVSD